MATKEEMNIYHKMLDGEVVFMGKSEKTIEIYEKYITFLQHQINVTKELIESFKTFWEKLK